MKINFISGVIYQVLTAICGFIIPRLTIEYYGSNVNGLLSSVSQFLSVITVMELGMGSVVPSSLYAPLARGESKKISCIYKSATRFYKRIAITFAIYACILSVTYPYIVRTEFGYCYVVGLILIISISTFVQYYFGCVDILLITADQRGYIRYFAQSIILVISTVICSVMLINRIDIRFVKLVSVLVFFIRPFLIRKYVIKNYTIDLSVEIIEDPIKQKKDGIIQHIAFFILTNTDVIILTLLSSLKNVSIYSVYFLIVNGIYSLFVAATNGNQARLGKLWAERKGEELRSHLKRYIYLIHVAVSVICGASTLLISPFIGIYTFGSGDGGYVHWWFGVLIVMAYTCIICRLPQLNMIFAAGHYKETKNCFVVTAIINMLLSILCVRKYGLIGVTIGTLLSMAIQEIWMVIYVERQIVSVGWCFHIRILLSDVIVYLFVLGINHFFNISQIIGTNIINWIKVSLVIVAILIAVVIVNSTVLHKSYR